MNELSKKEGLAVRTELERARLVHEAASRDYARRGGADEDERRLNRLESEAAWMRAEAMTKALHLLFGDHHATTA